MRASLTSALAALCIACACSGSSDAADAADAAVAGVTLIGCGRDAVHVTPVGTLVNNQWNAASAGAGPWRQCLRARQRPDGSSEYGWSWNWPARDGLYAYPEILVGASPWSDAPSNDPRFPRLVAETRHLRVSYDVESSFNGKNNLALEFWLTNPLAPKLANGRERVKAELMIWSDESEGLIPSTDKPAGTVDIDGTTWTVYLHRDWGDASGSTGLRWAYIAYHATRRSRSTNYDARKFFDDAMARGVITAADRIADVELGNELVSGSGASWVRNYTLALE